MNIRWNPRNNAQHATIAGPLAQVTAGNADAILHYEPEHKVIICTQHRYAVRNLDHHLRDQHAVSVKERRATIQRYDQFEVLEPADVPLPPPLRPPIRALGEPVDAFLCEEEECGFISINHSVIGKHCNKMHGWKWKKEEPEHWHEVKVQTFFNSGGLRRYFIVRAVECQPVDSLRGGEDDDGGEGEIAAIKSEWAEAWQKHEKELEKVDEEMARTDRTGWFNRTGWPEHLARRNMRHLAHASRMPDRDERLLQQAVNIVDLMIERAVAGLSTLGLETRRWLRSAKREEVDVRPMSRLQNPESQNTYAGYWKRFMCYCLRVATAVRESGEGWEDGGADEGEEGSEEVDGDEERDGEDDEDSESEDDEEGRILRDARELFPWQGNQKELAEELWRSLELDNEATQVEKMLELCRSFIFQSVGERPFSSAIVHFLAVLGIDAEMNRLRTANDFSYMLAGVVYCTRALAVELLLPSARREEQGDADREQYLHMRRQFLADGSYSPASTMISLLAYGKSVALNSGNAGSVLWSKDKTTLFLHGRPISMDRFRRMVADVITEAERLLWEELMWCGREERFTIPLLRIEDDVTFTKRGISFVSKSSNGLADGLDWMLKGMRRCEMGRKMRVDGIWNARRVRRYLRTVDRFLELLLFCTHTTGGQPARGTEVTTARFRNGCFQDRNVFVIDGQVVLVTRYHKSQALFDKPKVIPRFLPWRVGQLVSVYLAYVQGFREQLAVQVQGEGWSDYVWANTEGPWGTDRLTRIIARETAKGLGNRLTTLDYRHTAISIGREFVGDHFAHGYKDEVGEVEEPEMELESELELSAGRGEAVGSLRYGVRADIVKHLSIRSMETFRPLSEAWHAFLGLSSDREGRVRQQALWEKADRKRGHDDGSAGETQVPSAKRVKLDVGGGEERCVRKVDRAQVERAMQGVLGRPDVAFRSKEQELAMEAVLVGQTPLVVVLPTGGGKSLLFMVPARLDDAGVTIVVAPFRALVDDLVDRLKKAGIDCLEWRPGEVNPAAVVVVSADFAASWGFLSYASLLDREGLLERVFVDECHLTFTSSDWRPKLAHLKHLRALSRPMVLLTATLPPVLEHELSECMLVRCARYIRASTVRSNIRYMVQRCRTGQLMKTALEVCWRMKRRVGSQKGVIYCRGRQQCEDMATQLGCAHYHAGSVDKAERLQAWVEKGGFIVATSALGTGVDHAGIVFVLHVGMPYGMIDFAQESGRAGRAGEAVDSIVLVEEGWVERTADRLRKVDESAMAAFILSNGCRRAVMSGYLDGRAVECGELDGARCDGCGEGVTEWQGAQAEAEGEWQLVREALDEIADGCAACWVVEGDEDGHLHSLARCQKRAELTQAACDEFRRQIRYEVKSHSCTKCGISQKFCATGVGEGMRCQWPNVLIPMVRTAMGSGELGARILRRAGFEGETEDWRGYADWLGRRHDRRVWGEWMSNAMVVLIEVVLYSLGAKGR